MRADICIPTYNEAPTIAAAIEAVSQVLSATQLDWRIIIADNGSTDSTDAVVTALENQQVVLLPIPQKGKGAAVIAAARYSDADIFGFIDADLSAHPSHLLILIDSLTEETPVAIGSRLVAVSAVDRSLIRTVTSKIFNYLRSVLLGIRVKDTQCGLKVTVRRGKDYLLQCTETGWFMDVEWLGRLDRARIPIREIPIAWKESYFEGRGSKLRIIRDGFGAFAAFIRIRRVLATEYGTMNESSAL